ncbi:uncharacterized protein LOC133832721 [Humulus lupulus]|uniref:uncharacterized protein LOC133832721 n=1 Tax=Humulus lupulus TaxID=3486 RepID=UPI002B411456|nr:uncharacterized protein LOC133832721 [Humulus lupulus]
MEQTPKRRATRVTIEEPSSTPRAAASPASKEKGKKKATEPLEPLHESSDENVMDSECVLDLYSAPEVPEAPLSKKKASKRHTGESSKMPQAKKSLTAGLPEDRPSSNATPTSSPHEQQTPPAPAGSTPSPTALTDQTQQAGPASTGGDLTSCTFRSVKDRVAKIVNHDRCREAMAATETMDVDQILTCALNEFSNLSYLFLLRQAFLTLTVVQLRSGVVTEQSKSLEQRHPDKLKTAEAKYAEQLEAVLGENNKLAEELKEKQSALDKAIEQRDNFKESNRVNYHAAKKLEEDLTAGVDFSYLPERARQVEIAPCVARLAEEERARVPALPEISLETGMDGADNDAIDVVDQDTPQDPPAS